MDSLLMKTLKGGAMDSHLLLEIYNKQAKMIYFYLKRTVVVMKMQKILFKRVIRNLSLIVVVFLQKALSYIFAIAMNEFKKRLKKKGIESYFN